MTPSQLIAVAGEFRLCGGRDVSGRARHRLSRAGRSRPARAGRSAAGARRRRRRRSCRGRNRQDAGCDRDRGGVIGGKAGGRRRQRAPIIWCSYGREPFRDAVKRITDGRGADVVFDPVGGEIFENSLRCIAWGARLLVIGFTGGIGLARTNLLLIKGASVLGVRAGEAVRRNPALAEVRIARVSGVGGSRKNPPAHLAPPAAGRFCAGDAAVDRSQGDRPRGADDVTRSLVVPAFALGHAHIWCDGLTQVRDKGFQNREFV